MQKDPYIESTNSSQLHSMSNGTQRNNYNQKQHQPALNWNGSKNGSGDCRQRFPKKKNRSGRGKKNVDDGGDDDNVRVKANGEWDADFYFFGEVSAGSRAVEVNDFHTKSNA